MRARLPHVIGVVCNGLRVREQADRDATRKTLADMMRCLGPLFLHFVLAEVKSNLAVGYQRHVCGYTFQSVLAATQDMLGGAHLMNWILGAGLWLLDAECETWSDDHGCEGGNDGGVLSQSNMSHSAESFHGEPHDGGPLRWWLREHHSAETR